MFKKVLTVTLSTQRSSLAPLKKGRTGFKVPLFTSAAARQRGDLGESNARIHYKQDFSEILLSQFLNLHLALLATARPRMNCGRVIEKAARCKLSQ